MWSVHNRNTLEWKNMFVFKAANETLVNKYLPELQDIDWDEVKKESKTPSERSALVVKMQLLFWKMTDVYKDILILPDWPWLYAHKGVKCWELHVTTNSGFVATLKTKRQALSILEEFAKRDEDIAAIKWSHEVIQKCLLPAKKEKETFVDSNGYKWKLQKKIGKFGIVQLINTGERKATYALVYTPTNTFVYRGSTQKKTKEIASAWKDLPANVIEEAMADWTYIAEYKCKNGCSPKCPGPNGEQPKVRHMNILSSII